MLVVSKDAMLRDDTARARPNRGAKDQAGCALERRIERRVAHELERAIEAPSADKTVSARAFRRRGWRCANHRERARLASIW